MCVCDLKARRQKNEGVLLGLRHLIGRLSWRKRSFNRDINEMKVPLNERHEEEIINLPKKFDYYCSVCLHQSNIFKKICPKCGKGELLRAKKND